MKVKWTEWPNDPEWIMDMGDYRPTCWKFEGEIVGTVRSWGTTTFVVMLDDGKIREVPAKHVALIR